MTSTPTGWACASCGSRFEDDELPAAIPATRPVTFADAPAVPAAHRKTPSPSEPGTGLSVAALLLNMFIWPGLGTLVAGRPEGWAQGFLTLFGIVFAFAGLVGLGVLLVLVSWLWALVTAVGLLQNADRSRTSGTMS